MKMKSIQLFFFSSLVCHASMAQFGDWPVAPASYIYVGATELNQTAAGNYALLQAKTNGTTFLNSPSSIQFRIANDDKMVLTNSGYFGIGTTGPIARLSVAIPVATSNVPGNAAAYGAYFTDNTSATMAIRSLGNGAIHLATDGSSRKIILGGGVFEQTMVVADGGKVGIGTNNPATRLSLGTSALTRTIALHDDANDWYGFGIQSYQMRLQVGNSQSRFSFYAGDNSEVMTIKGGGNVGIGTTNPNQKLTVNGVIYGREVLIDQLVPGPDYVFEKDYHLPSLDDIKSYIEKHKHLPEVPSAKEMVANGINVGEMEMILLKKVEELTLYLLEQQKVNARMDEKIHSLENIVTTLSKKK